MKFLEYKNERGVRVFLPASRIALLEQMGKEGDAVTRVVFGSGEDLFVLEVVDTPEEIIEFLNMDGDGSYLLLLLPPEPQPERSMWVDCDVESRTPST